MALTRQGQQQIVMSPRYCSQLFISIACPSPDEASSTRSTSWWRPALQPCKPWKLSWPKTTRTSPAGGASTSQRSCQRKTLITTTASKQGHFFFFKLPWERFVADHFNYHDDSGKCAMRQCGHFSSLLPPWPCGKELLGNHKQQESNAIRDLTTSMYAYSVKTQVFHQQWVVGWALMGCVSLIPLQSHYKSLLENISSERKIASGIWQLLR